jgi:hypothetical protein
VPDSPELACSPCEAAAECLPTERWVTTLDASSSTLAELDSYQVSRHALPSESCLQGVCADDQELWDWCVTVHEIPAAPTRSGCARGPRVECCQVGDATDCRAVEAEDACVMGEIPMGTGEQLELVGTFDYPAEVQVTISVPS